MMDRQAELGMFLAGVVGAVEASSYETLCLWREYTDTGKKPKLWIQGRSGLLVIVCNLTTIRDNSACFDRPVCLSLNVNTVLGHRVLFYEPTSQLVDYVLINSWLEQNLPQTALRPDGFPNKTDAQNFSNVLTSRVGRGLGEDWARSG